MPDNTTNLFAAKLATGQGFKETTINEALELLDNAIAGKRDISTTGGTTTLKGTVAEPEAQHIFLNVTGTLSSNATIEIPVDTTTSGRNRIFVVKNGTTGAFTLTVKKVGGTGVTVTQGATALLLYNGSDIQHLITDTANFGGAAAWTSWTPTWTNLTVGNGTVVAKYIQIGKTVFARVSIVFGSTTSISGSVSFTMPVTRATYAGTAGITPIGIAYLFDTSLTATVQGQLGNLTTTTAQVIAWNSAGTYVSPAALSSTVPFTWATGDEINAEFFYEAA